MRYDTTPLVESVLAELSGRSLGHGYYANNRSERQPVLAAQYAVIQIHGIIGRQIDPALAETLHRFQRPDGTYDGNGSAHELSMVLLALNLLGAAPRYPVESQMAPLDIEALPDWVDRHNWNTTHKDLSCAVFPRLTDPRLPAGWVETLLAELHARYDRWLRPDADRWEVISRLYHVLSIHLATNHPFPFPERLMPELDRLHWEDNDAGATNCTDFDYALMICKLPYPEVEAQRRLHRIMDRKIADFPQVLPRLLAQDNHQMTCHLMNIAVFQRLLPDRFTGPLLRDILHEVALFHIPAHAMIGD